jgi:hypothetical protein
VRVRPCVRVLIKKLLVSQVVKKFLFFNSKIFYSNFLQETRTDCIPNLFHTRRINPSYFCEAILISSSLLRPGLKSGFFLRVSEKIVEYMLNPNMPDLCSYGFLKLRFSSTR